MTTKDITVNGGVFRCPVDWRVEDAEGRIRSHYGLQFGGIEHNNVPLRRVDLIGSFTGTLVFVGGQPIQQPATSQAQVAVVQGIPVDEARKRRWNGLNAVLDINKKAKTRAERQNSLGYSYANWEQVKDYFPLVVGDLGTATGSGLPLPLLHALHQYLSFATICFGSISEVRERVHLIAPIIIIVCSFFHGNIQILAEEEVEGFRVHSHCHFGFVLKRGNKRICIVEAKKDDLLQGRTQSLIGCESLCDVDDLPVTYGIATNYLAWVFLKNEADKITEEMLMVSLKDGRPTIESLKAIADKIIAILE